jgi:hypothetical protein
MYQLNMLYANVWFYIPIIIWTLFWKGCALWFAAKDNKKWWFVALLILNTVGILEIVYIFVVAKKKLGDIKMLFTKPTVL